MGMYLNPGNHGFEEILNNKYVDKTGMIRYINRTISTTQKLTCISRPRRFGKSLAAQMLCAYYDASCDSHALFDHLEISRTDDYEKHLNQYNVIYLDISGFISNVFRSGKNLCDVPDMILQAIQSELKADSEQLQPEASLSENLIAYVKKTGKKFVFIIDEWDAIIREAKNDPISQKRYFSFLRELFKNGNFTPQVVAAAYMTGILPIKKDGSQSAISDFQEYTILDPVFFAEFTGFTEAEVYDLCISFGMDFSEAKAWYDGYSFERAGSIYNPYSVMTAMQRGRYQSYWQKTSASEALMTYINMNFEGLQEDILRLIAGEELEVYTGGFENDFETFKSRDDVLTLLIHLGYLAYDQTEGLVRIPNEEIRSEFKKLIQNEQGTKLAGLIQASRQLLQDTLSGNEQGVAAAIERIRDSEYAPTYYNNEQALRYVIKFAYIVCVDQYLKIEEMPSGHGVADVVFLPKKRSRFPAMIVELKWNKTAAAALEQIRDRKYPELLLDYEGDIVLAGISYDEITKKHECRIERLKKQT